MCRLFGFRSNVPSRAHRSLVEAENALAVQASAHSDGWGIGYYRNEDAYVLKAAAGASTDDRFARVTSRLQSHTMVVHVRRATVGGCDDNFNAHPFRHGAWLFAHNGTIFEFERLRDRMLAHTAPHLVDLIFGTTDSEHLFAYLLTAMLAAGVPERGPEVESPDIASHALRAALDRLFRWADEIGAPPPIVNFILTNGVVFLAQRAGLELYLATQKITCRDFATCAEPDKVCMDVMPPLALGLRGGPRRPVNHALVASEPIGEEDIWEEIPEGALIMVDREMALRVLPPTRNFVRCPHPPAPAPRALPTRLGRVLRG